MNTNKPKKVLFLCTGNSARSIIAEYILRKKGLGRYEAHSAGANPTGTVNPLALWVLKNRYAIDAHDARSKSWDEFKYVMFDFVITVCDHAREMCPIWPGQPVIAHWGSPDPAAFEGTDDKKKLLFINVASQISQRINIFCALSDEKLQSLTVRQIGDKFKIEEEKEPARQE